MKQKEFFTITGIKCDYFDPDCIKIPVNKITAVTGEQASSKKALFIDTIAFEIEKRIQALQKLSSGFLVNMQELSRESNLPPLPPILQVPGTSFSSSKTVLEVVQKDLMLPKMEHHTECPECKATTHKHKLNEIVQSINSKYLNQSISCSIRIWTADMDNTQSLQQKVETLFKQGYSYFYFDNTFIDLNSDQLPFTTSRQVELLLDTIKIDNQNTQRLTETLELGLSISNQGIRICSASDYNDRNINSSTWYSNHRICPACGYYFKHEENKQQDSFKLKDLKDKLSEKTQVLLKLFSLESLPYDELLKNLKPTIKKSLELISLINSPPTSPSILLLKHPTAGLSRKQASKFLSMLEHLRKTHTVVVITSDPIIIQSSDYLIRLVRELDKNIIEYSGEPKETEFKKAVTIDKKDTIFSLEPGTVHLQLAPFFGDKRIQLRESILEKAQEFTPKPIHNISCVSSWLPNTLTLTSQYLGLHQKIIEFLAQTREVKVDGLSSTQFSLSSKKGLYCKKCKATGIRVTNKSFRKYEICTECSGNRFQDTALKYRIKNKTLNELLEMSLEELHSLFQALPGIAEIYKAVSLFNLEYLKAGTPVSFLSDSEKTRLKLIKEVLSYRNHTFFLLEYPFIYFSPEETKKIIKKIEKNFCPEHTFVLFETRDPF